MTDVKTMLLRACKTPFMSQGLGGDPYKLPDGAWRAWYVGDSAYCLVVRHKNDVAYLVSDSDTAFIAELKWFDNFSREPITLDKYREQRIARGYFCQNPIKAFQFLENILIAGPVRAADSHGQFSVPDHLMRQ